MWKRRMREEKPQKGKGRKRIFAGVIIAVVVLCTVIVLGNQSYTVEQAIEMGSRGNNSFICEEIIYQKKMKDGRELVVYGNPEGNICSAIIKKTALFYKAEKILGGLTANPVNEKKVKMEVVSYDYFRFYLIGVITDDAVACVRYGEDIMDMAEYKGTRVVIALDEDKIGNPQYYTKGFQVLDGEGNILESVPPKLY